MKPLYTEGLPFLSTLGLARLVKIAHPRVAVEQP